MYGAPGEIRTPDRSVRSRVLYPAELQAHIQVPGSRNLALGTSPIFEGRDYRCLQLLRQMTATLSSRTNVRDLPKLRYSSANPHYPNIYKNGPN